MGFNILVLEDEPIVRRDICHMVERKFKDFNVYGAGNLPEAEQVSDQFRPDLALVDLKLNGLFQGIEFAKNLKNKSPQSKIIFITGYTSDELLKEMSSITPENIIAKPFHPGQIEAAIFKSISVPSPHSFSSQINEKDKAGLLSFYEGLLNQMALISATDKEGRIILANEKFCEISGYKEEELLGQNHRLLNSSHHSKQFWMEMYETVLSGKVWTGVVKNKRKDGSLYWVKSYISGYFDNNKKIQKYFSVRFDITQDKFLLDFLKMQDELFQGQINETAFQRFMQGVLHNLANIVSPLPFLIKKISSSIENGDMNHPIEKIQKINNRLDELIHDLRRMHDGLQFENPSDIQKISAQEFMSCVKTYILTSLPGKKKLIKFNIPDDIEGLLTLAPAYMAKTIFAIVNNCIEFNPEKRDLEIAVSFQKKSPWLIIDITDNGQGLSPEALKSAFLPFYTTAGEVVYRKGIGLKEARKTVIKAGGHIKLKNLNPGAEVSLYLPFV